jgi:hypothetical protein
MRPGGGERDDQAAALRFYERRGLKLSLVHFYGRRGG